MPNENTFPRDDNGNLFDNIDTFGVVRSAPSAFTGGTANTRGDDGGTSDPLNIFTVTGDVLVRVFGVCTTDLAGATATVSVGVTGNLAGIIPATTATDIDANDLFIKTAPAVGVDTLANVPGPFVVVNGLDIVEAVATADVTSGQIYYICLWRPLSRDGNVVSA